MKRNLFCSAAIAALTAAPAFAQSAPAPASAPETADIIVTASKRPESIQRTPASVLAINSVGLERANIKDFDDLPRVAPSLTISKTTQPANNSINIRGIGTYAYSIATQPSVAVVIDDVPQSFQAAAFAALVDIQQIEVLRGPQSTLFGKAASAGVVNITTAAPTDTFTARGEAMVTNDHEYRFQASLSGPLTSNLRARIAGNYSDYRGTIYNLTTGNWQNGSRDASIRLKLLWEPTPDLSVTFSPYYNDTKATCCAPAQYLLSPGVTFSRANLPQSTILNGITPGPNNRLTRLDVDTRGDARDYGAALRIAYDIGGPTLLSITSYDAYKLWDFKDSDSSDFNFQTLTVSGVNFAGAPAGGVADGGTFDVRSVTQELRLTSPSSKSFEYVAGLFFSNTDSTRDYVRGSNFHTSFNGIIFNGQQQLPTTNGLAYSDYLANAKAQTYAAFAQGTFHLTPSLAVIGGVRLHHEKVSYDFFDRDHNVRYGSPRCSTSTPTAGVNISTCDNDTVFLGRAAIQYQVTPDVMFFGNFAKGYKGLAYDLTSILTTRTAVTAIGSCNGSPVADCVAARQPIPPETSTSYEIGFKTAFFDRKVTWNVTAFYADYRNFQAQSRDLELGQNILQSIGKVTTKGIESELAIYAGGLTINAAGAYNIAQMDSFPNAPCFAAQTVAQGCVSSRQDLSGKRLPSAPEWSFSITGEYKVPIDDKRSIFLNSTYRWQSDMLFSLVQDPDSYQEAYGIWNIGVGIQDDNWKFSAFVNNLTNQNYALTKGRDNAWNFNPAATVPTNAVNWKPARDSERYFGVRASFKY